MDKITTEASLCDPIANRPCLACLLLLTWPLLEGIVSVHSGSNDDLTTEVGIPALKLADEQGQAGHWLIRD